MNKLIAFIGTKTLSLCSDEGFDKTDSTKQTPTHKSKESNNREVKWFY